MLKAAGLVCLLSLAGAAQASADRFDAFGCSNQSQFRLNDLLGEGALTCEFLYLMRNRIYAEHGNCFRTARGKTTFGNRNCVTDDTAALGLNAAELHNAVVILQAERVKGCAE